MLVAKMKTWFGLYTKVQIGKKSNKKGCRTNEHPICIPLNGAVLLPHHTVLLGQLFGLGDLLAVITGQFDFFGLAFAI